jgi:2-phospho-L-lactate guanylyltransferase (CobY/MobA/RfbA family)
VITAILPFRSVADSKRRMESALTDQDRMELSARLLVRTLAALRNARSIGRTILVSPDPLARELARSAGAEAIDDHGVPLNEAIRLGLDHATAGGASTALIVPVDLAHVSARAIDELTDAWCASGAASGGRESRASPTTTRCPSLTPSLVRPPPPPRISTCVPGPTAQRGRRRSAA